MGANQGCPLCGSDDLSWASGGTNAFLDNIGGTGLGLTDCNNCGNQILPIEFKNEEARLAFFKKKNVRQQETKEKIPASNITQAKAVFRWELLLVGLAALVNVGYFSFIEKNYLLAVALFLAGAALLYWTWKAHNGT